MARFDSDIRTGKGFGAQSALEFLITYSWAFLILVIMLAVALLLPSVTSVSSYIPATCYIQPTFPCLDTLLIGYRSGDSGSNTIQYSVVFLNKLQTTVYFPTNSFNVSVDGLGSYGANIYLGNCTPALAQPGTQVTCYEGIPGTVEPSYGSELNTFFSVLYQTCSGVALSTCTSGLYKTSGYATQTIGLPGGYYVLKIKTYTYAKASGSPFVSNSYVLVGGSPYSNGSRLVLPAGTLLLSPQLSSYGAFVAYNVVGSDTTDPNVVANGISTLTINSNSTLEVKYTEALCDFCNYTNGGLTPECPASCPTAVKCSTGMATLSSTTTTSTSTSSGSTSLPTTTVGSYSCDSCASPQAGYECPVSCPDAATCGPNGSGVECVSNTGFSGAASADGANQSNEAGYAGGDEAYSVTISPSVTTTIPALTTASTTIAAVPAPLASQTYACGCQPVEPGYSCPSGAQGYWCVQGQSIACFGASSVCGAVPAEKECT